MIALTAVGLANLYADGRIDIDRAVNSPTVTIRYEGLKAALIELKLNGKSVSSRAVDKGATRGETNFAINLAELADGDNVLEVCVYDASGKLLGTQKTTLTADREGNGPVFIAGPKPGSTVQGPIEIKLGLNRDFREMYVSFFIDDEWKALKNFPPYSYLWDTTRSLNGWHEIQAWVVDEANNTFKTRKIKVFVNNPGGRTERMNPVDPPSQNQESKPSAKPTQTTPSSPAVKPAIGDPASTRPAGTAPSQASQAKNAVLEPKTPPIRPRPVEATPSKNPVGAQVGAGRSELKVPQAQPATSPSHVAEPVAPRVVGPTTPSATKGVVGPTAGMKATSTGSGVPTGPKALTPTGTRVQASKPPVVAKASPAQVGSVSAMQNTVAQLQTIRIAKGKKLPNAGAVTVLVDSKIVEFDVQPRIEKGIGLTPFRHLFEHAGGEVKWQGVSKTVLANGLGKEITIQIGKATAVVNGKTVGMEVAASIDHGRTIVPLSFIEDSLNVDIEYDPNTGHVLITSRK